MATSTCQYKFLKSEKTCPHPTLEGNYCLFHSHNDKKDASAFWEGIQGKLKNEDFDFEGYCFPPDVIADFRGKKFKNANFLRAIFKGGVNFRGVTFYGELTVFTAAKFSGEFTDFGQAKFSGELTLFNWAKFSGERTDFSLAEFSGELAFSWAEFSGGFTHFHWAKFSGELTDFSLAEFSGESIDFSRANFYGCGTTLFVNTTFKGRCRFLGVEFPLGLDQFVIFKGTIYPLDLSKTVFLYSNYDRILFRNCKFPEGPDELFGLKFSLWRRKGTKCLR